MDAPLRYALEHPAVGRVTTIGRRKVGISHPKLNEVIHQDFANCSALAQVLSDQHAAKSFAWVCIPGGIGHRAPYDNSGLHDRVRTSSPWQQPRRSVRLLKREWRGPDGTKSDVLRTLQGRGRERAAREGLCQRLHFPARYIYPVTPRREPNFGYRLLRVIYPAFRLLFPVPRKFEPTTWAEPWWMSRCVERVNVEGSFSRTATSKPLSSSACS